MSVSVFRHNHRVILFSSGDITFSKVLIWCRLSACVQQRNSLTHLVMDEPLPSAVRENNHALFPRAGELHWTQDSQWEKEGRLQASRAELVTTAAELPLYFSALTFLMTYPLTFLVGSLWKADESYNDHLGRMWAWAGGSPSSRLGFLLSKMGWVTTSTWCKGLVG